MGITHRTEPYMVKADAFHEGALMHDVLTGTIIHLDRLNKRANITLDIVYYPRSEATDYGKIQTSGYQPVPGEGIIDLVDIPIIYNCKDDRSNPANAFRLDDSVYVLAIKNQFFCVGLVDGRAPCDNWTLIQFTFGSQRCLFDVDAGAFIDVPSTFDAGGIVCSSGFNTDTGLIVLNEAFRASNQPGVEIGELDELEATSFFHFFKVTTSFLTSYFIGKQTIKTFTSFEIPRWNTYGYYGSNIRSKIIVNGNNVILYTAALYDGPYTKRYYTYDPETEIMTQTNIEYLSEEQMYIEIYGYYVDEGIEEGDMYDEFSPFLFEPKSGEFITQHHPQPQLSGTGSFHQEVTGVIYDPNPTYTMYFDGWYYDGRWYRREADSLFPIPVFLHLYGGGATVSIYSQGGVVEAPVPIIEDYLFSWKILGAEIEDSIVMEESQTVREIIDPHYGINGWGEKDYPDWQKTSQVSATGDIVRFSQVGVKGKWLEAGRKKVNGIEEFFYRSNFLSLGELRTAYQEFYGVSMPEEGFERAVLYSVRDE